MATVIFAVGALIVLAGAMGVVLTRSPVHAAISLVATLFGVAILFLTLDANFLAAVQVIVYAGAIVVLFLFVIMLLGVETVDDLRTDPLVVQRWAGLAISALIGVGLLVIVLSGKITGLHSATGTASTNGNDVYDISRHLFTDYLFAFEITSILLVIGVVGAVALAKRTKNPGPAIDADEPPDTFTDESLEETVS